MTAEEHAAFWTDVRWDGPEAIESAFSLTHLNLRSAVTTARTFTSTSSLDTTRTRRRASHLPPPHR